MKVLLVCVLCVVAGGVAGSAVAWPGAAVALSTHQLNTVIPAQTKAFGYSTTQYLNTLPISYSLGLRPQFAYQVPQLSSIQAIQPAAYYPVAGSSYYPSSIFYPTVGAIGSFVPAGSIPAAPPSPGAPMAPASPPSFPQEQPSGDSDTAVIESADSPSEAQRQQAPADQVQATPESPPSPPQLPPANTFPNFPSLPQFPQGSGQLPPFPQIPQFPQGSEQLPPFPQIPQIPEGSVPAFPQLPQIPGNPLFPQSPSQSPSSTFPGAASDDKGLNDEDTIAVESA